MRKGRLSERRRLKLANRVLPFRKPELILMDGLDIALGETKVSQIATPPLGLPNVSPELCPIRPEITDMLTLHISPIIEDITSWLKQQLLCPEIESFAMLTHIPRRAGKAYGKSSTSETPLSFFDIDEGEKTCIHGLRKRYCSTCINGEKQRRERKLPGVDLFDLIFPILQPPLGEDFDSPVAFPPGQRLYDFQCDGVRFLAQNERALLCDEMGLGKSIQAIVAIRLLFRMGKITNALILSPRSVVGDWEDKLWKWAPELRLSKVRGTKEQRQIYWKSPAHLYLSTYETWSKDFKSGSQDNLPIVDSPTGNRTNTKYDLVVLDEIQKIKNPKTSITKAVRQIDARWRWGLSGTPLENRLEELISIFAYIKPGILRYEDANSPIKVKRVIKDYIKRRRKTDALPDLPEKVCEDIWLELTDAQRETYERVEQGGIVDLNEKGDYVTVQHVLALITKLKQICNIDPQSGESCKLEHLIEKLPEIIEQGDKALVFSQYPEKTLKVIEPKLQRFEPLIYHGSLSDSKRDDIIKTFEESEGKHVLLMSVKAGGLGITLTRANHVFHFDLWWNPSTAEQAEGRADRIGQPKRVFVTSLFTRDTVEQRIQNILEGKRGIFEAVIGDLSDRNLKKCLSEEELFSVFNIQKAKKTTIKGMETEGFTMDSLNRTTPRQFEQLVAGLYEKLGYHAKLTPQSKDKGIDIWAQRVSETGTDLLAIQCKHYPKTRVGIEHARALYGVIQAQPSITKGVLVTSGDFSRECKDFARGKRIELFNGNYVRGLIEKYGISSFKKMK